MFRRLSEPLPLSEASLLAMRPALNAPVLNVGFLPVGPARAALVVFGEEWGGIGIALGIRSNESGQVAVFRNQESIEPDVSVTAALEPALAEAERMGFLFDEDMVSTSTDGRPQALSLWGRLMGELDLPPAPRAVPRQPAASESILAEPVSTDPLPPARPNVQPPAELVLDDVAEIELPEIALEEVAVPTPVAKAAPAAPSAPPARPVQSSKPAAPPPPDVSQQTEPMIQQTAPPPAVAPAAAAAAPAEQNTEPVPDQPTLSKFRHADAAAEAKGGSQLGRIPLVRVRKGKDGVKRVSALARLLSNF